MVELLLWSESCRRRAAETGECMKLRTAIAELVAKIWDLNVRFRLVKWGSGCACARACMHACVPTGERLCVLVMRASMRLSVRLPIRPSVRPSVRPSPRPPVCLSVCQCGTRSVQSRTPYLYTINGTTSPQIFEG